VSCVACSIEAEIGTAETPHPVPERFHTCVRAKNGPAFDAADFLKKTAREVSDCPKCGGPLHDPTDYVDGKPAQRVFFDCAACGFQMVEVLKRRLHELKTWPSYFEAALRGDKPFEIRKNDRGFAVGDEVVLCEWEPDGKRFTGRRLRRRITYVTDASGIDAKDDHVLHSDYVVLGLVAERNWRGEAVS
jgi:hypothetical protein